ncbi:protein still life, isoform SIF type 1-like [Pollicipes pollicipes]|uniref:protein still life, isoform SIF type 1-like n=1 Tax=Pollicipes pollicipes TaxID=41117 RepID=UPI0018851D93|nr:protein still life, isoform SIF type 1-like [Pollicipes pollicipes]
MGNSFIRKNYEESPWLVTRRTGNLLRLWAEVFHVSSTGSGTVKWQQISDDLVPVSLTCIQDSPSYVFHITAYNSQVDKILDVRLTQPDVSYISAQQRQCLLRQVRALALFPSWHVFPL